MDFDHKERMECANAGLRRAHMAMVRSASSVQVRNPWKRERGVKRRQRLMRRRLALAEAERVRRRAAQ